MAAHWCKEAVEGAYKNPLDGLSGAPSKVPMTPAQGALQQQQQLYQQYYAQYYDYYNKTVVAPPQQPAYSHNPTSIPSSQAPISYQYPGVHQAAGVSAPHSVHYAAPPVVAGGNSITSSAYQYPVQQRQALVAPAVVAATSLPSAAPKPHQTILPTKSFLPGQTVLPTQTYQQALVRPVIGAPAPKPAPTTASATGPGGWPPNLRRFVERAFGLCHSDADRQFVSDSLRAKLSHITSSGKSLESYNWDAEPTPDPKKKDAPPQSASLTSTSTSMGTAGPATDPTGVKKKKSRFATAENKQSIQPNVAAANQSYYGYAPQNNPNLVSPPSSAADAKSKKKAHGIGEVKIDEKALRKRQDRFATDEAPSKKKKKGNNDMKSIKSAEISYASLYNDDNDNPNSGEFDMTKLIVVGTCRKIEKDYFRLTSAPDPATVRPEAVLVQALTLLKQKWDSKTAEYVYLCSQFKAIRQDLTVQHIVNEFTVEVYETHARIALQCQDLNEYNQCQTQLKHFYAGGLNGSQMEFVAYRILYYVYLLGNKKYQRGSADLINVMAELDDSAFSHPAVVHALAVREATQSDNYVRFFSLYKKTPNLGNHLLDLMLTSWRMQAALRIVKAYKPSVEVAMVTKNLGFETERECELFLSESGGKIIQLPRDDGQGITMSSVLDTKTSSINLGAIVKQDSLLL